MSDNEDNYSISVASDEEENENVYKKSDFIKKQNAFKKPTIRDYDDDDDEVADSDEEDENKVMEMEENEDEDELLYQDDDDDTDEEDIEDDEEMVDSDEENAAGGGSGKKQVKNASGGANKKNKQDKDKDKKQNNIQLDIGGNEIYDDEEDDEDENYLQKFDREITKDYIMNFHPECLNHNYDEIKALSKVTRDEFNIIIDPLHKTVPFLTKYERARILGQRAKQIECGAKPLVKVPENIIDSYIIAELELEQKKIPFIIRRPIPSGGSEYWNLKDLEIINF
jgi:DNA-directed RNA polymerase I, II, and III subunit RPABC2